MIFPTEYDLAINQIKKNRLNQGSDLGKLKDKTIFVERALMEVPETLDTMFTLRLSDSEKEEFREKKSVRWFVKEFPMFKLAQKV